MEADELYITLIAVQGELQNAVTELFAMFCVEHKEAGSKNSRQAFSHILKKCKDLDTSLETLTHAFNKNKIYDTTDEGTFVLRDEINLKILDSLFIYDALKNLKGFPAHQEKLHRRRRLLTCKEALHQQCCLACNHKCSKCERKECKDDSDCHPGLKCNQHPCRNCDEKKEVCLLSSSVCCKKCNTCFYCGSKLKLDPSERCSRLRLVCGIATLRKFRWILESLTYDDCRLLLDGTRALPEFPLCRSINELCQSILEAYKDVLNYASVPEHFHKQPAMSQKTVDEKLNNISAIFKHKNTESLLFTQQEEILKALGFLNEGKVEASDEYTNVMSRIEALNASGKFHRDRSEVLVDRANSLDEQDTSVGHKHDENKCTDKESSVDSQQNTREGQTETPAPSCNKTDSHVVSCEAETKNQTFVKSHAIGEDSCVKEERGYPISETSSSVKPDLENQTVEGNKHSMDNVLEEIVSCVNEIKANTESSKTEIQKDTQMLRDEISHQRTSQEGVNERMLTQLSAVMDKLIAMETERKNTEEERKREMEEIKKNQKNLLDMFQAQQNAKAAKKHGIFKHKIR